MKDELLKIYQPFGNFLVQTSCYNDYYVHYEENFAQKRYKVLSNTPNILKLLG